MGLSNSTPTWKAIAIRADDQPAGRNKKSRNLHTGNKGAILDRIWATALTIREESGGRRGLPKKRSDVLNAIKERTGLTCERSDGYWLMTLLYDDKKKRTPRPRKLRGKNL